MQVPLSSIYSHGNSWAKCPSPAGVERSKHDVHDRGHDATIRPRPSGDLATWPRNCLIWVFLVLTLLNPGSTVLGDEELSRKELLEAFQQSSVIPKQGGFIQPVGPLPELVWDRPFLVRAVWGHFPLKIRWFDPEGNETQQVDRPGRYGVHVEGRPPAGPVIRRARTFFFFDPAAASRLAHEPLWEVPLDAKLGISQEAWDQHRPHLQAFAAQALVRALTTSEEAAILGASLFEWRPSESLDPLGTPNIRHQEYHLAIRKRLQAEQIPTSPLERPLVADPPATRLVDGSPREAGLSDELPEKLRDLSRKWMLESGEPFTMVVARRGVVVFHEAFGERDGRPVGQDTLYPLFSLTKTLTGTMFGMFVDQGLVALDDPLGRILHDFPTAGPQAMTFRACMMHVTGLQGHSQWGGLDNPWFDNVVANGLENLVPAYAYSGVPYDLTGFAMQMITGKAIPRLFHDHLFAPLEMEGAKLTGLGTGAELRAIDLAKLGQLWLNRGVYGDHRFFGDEVWKEHLPQPYEARFPGLAPRAADYGIGTQWVNLPHPRAGREGLPEDAMLLSRRTLGHGSFSGTVFRVDLENEIVLAVGRFSAGPNHHRYLEELVSLLAESLR
jgi:CubicO group peptidase (beta-lactamase class C family)